MAMQHLRVDFQQRAASHGEGETWINDRFGGIQVLNVATPEHLLTFPQEVGIS
jgi:hypothetical protein